MPLAGAEFSPARDSHQLSVVVLLLVRETDGSHALTEPHRGGELDDGQVPVHAAEAEVIVMKSSKRENDEYIWQDYNWLLLWTNPLLAITFSDIMIPNYNLIKLCERLDFAVDMDKPWISNFDLGNTMKS